jgi:chromosome segregation ATPase
MARTGKAKKKAKNKDNTAKREEKIQKTLE